MSGSDQLCDTISALAGNLEMARQSRDLHRKLLFPHTNDANISY